MTVQMVDAAPSRLCPSNAILVRVGIDASHGHWNAPADPNTREFVYVPIPEVCLLKPGHEIAYDTLLPALNTFSRPRMLDVDRDLRFPPALRHAATHLDPDFDHLTYGDDGGRRGSGIVQLDHGDLLVFYASLRLITDKTLIYALIGMLTIDQIVPATDVSDRQAHENAHSRRMEPSPTEFVLRGLLPGSGRFTHYLPIGGWRDGAYRVYQELLEDWGDLSVRNGFVQRSGRPPRFRDPQRFLNWLDRRHIVLTAHNN